MTRGQLPRRAIDPPRWSGLRPESGDPGRAPLSETPRGPARAGHRTTGNGRTAGSCATPPRRSRQAPGIRAARTSATAPGTRPANIEPSAFQCILATASSRTVVNALSVPTLCHSPATLESPQRITPISSCGHRPRQPSRKRLHELREVRTPEEVSEQQRLKRAPSSGLPHLVPQGGHLAQERPPVHKPGLFHEPMQQMKLPHVALAKRLSRAELLGRLHPRPSHLLAHRRDHVAPETPLVGEVRQELLADHLERGQSVAHERRFSERFVRQIRREPQSRVVRRRFRPQRPGALRLQQGPDGLDATRPVCC